MITPCNNTCQIDVLTKLCIGCKRKIEEIANWAKYTQDQRKEIMNDICNR